MAGGIILTKDELKSLLVEQRISPAGVDWVIAAACEPPRKVRGGMQKNLTGERATRLTTWLDEGDVPVVGRLQFASFSAEFAFIAEREYYQDSVLLIDQPKTVTVLGVNRLGVASPKPYTPDFLVVRRQSTLVVETKTDEEAARLTCERPKEWVRTESGFRHVPAYNFFSALGIDHRVVLSSSIPALRVQNLEFMRGRTERGLQCSDAEFFDVVAYVRANSPVSVRDIVDDLGLQNADPIVSAIIAEEIYVSLDNVCLTDPHSRVICRSAPEAELVARTVSSVQGVTACSEPLTLSGIVHPRHYAEVGYRLAAVSGEQVSTGWRREPSARTQRRWKRKYLIEGPAGLAPRWDRCGRRAPLHASWNRKLAMDQIVYDRSKKKRRSRTQSHLEYEKALEAECERLQEAQAPISYSEYCRLWRERAHNVDDALGVGGRRLANAVAPYGNVDDQRPIAVRPFQVAHVDHCQLPVVCGSTDPEAPRKKPWLTLLIDQWNDEPLACFLRRDPPSSKVDMLLVRECVRRHGRLPEIIISDGGPDFRGDNFSGCLAALGVHWIRRPRTCGRAGATVERPFGTLATTICQGFDGFVPDIKNRRSISASKDPLRGPFRDFTDLAKHAKHVIYDVLPNLVRDDGSASPCERRLYYESIYGESGVVQHLDLKLLIATSVAIKTGTQIEPAGALRLKDDRRFYCPSLVNKWGSAAKFFPHADVEDPTVVYVLVEGRWCVAKHSLAKAMKGRTDESIAADSFGTSSNKKSMDARRRSLHSRPPTGSQPCPSPGNEGRANSDDEQIADSSCEDASEVRRDVRINDIGTLEEVASWLQNGRPE